MHRRSWLDGCAAIYVRQRSEDRTHIRQRSEGRTHQTAPGTRAVRLLYLIGDFPAAPAVARSTSGTRHRYERDAPGLQRRLKLLRAAPAALHYLLVRFPPDLPAESGLSFDSEATGAPQSSAGAGTSGEMPALLPRQSGRLSAPPAPESAGSKTAPARKHLLQKPVPAGRSHARTPAAYALTSRQAEKLRIRKQVGKSEYSSGRYYKYATYCRQRKHQPGRPVAIPILFVLVFDFLFNHFHSLSTNESSYEPSRADHLWTSSSPVNLILYTPK